MDYIIGTLLAILGIYISWPISFYISKSKIKYKKYLGYSYPSLILIYSFYFIWDSITCVGKLCNFGDYILFPLLSSLALSSIIFFMGFTNKWKIKNIAFALFVSTFLSVILPVFITVLTFKPGL